MTYWVYMLASRRHGTLYVGVTNSVERRTAEHREKSVPGFTRRYGVDRLVWFRAFGDVTEAIHFEKQLKRWRRDWKVRLIEADNPHWDDLYPAMMREDAPLHPDISAALANPAPEAAIPPACHPGFGEAEDRDPLTPRSRDRPRAAPLRFTTTSGANGSRSFAYRENRDDSLWVEGPCEATPRRRSHGSHPACRPRELKDRAATAPALARPRRP